MNRQWLSADGAPRILKLGIEMSSRGILDIFQIEGKTRVVEVGIF